MKLEAEKYDLQDDFLITLKNEENHVILYLQDGVPVEGKIVAFDNFCLCLQQHAQLQLVYKHDIYSILRKI